jgi:hypothetical protein
LPGVNPEIPVAAATTVLVCLRYNPKVYQAALNPKADAEKRPHIAVDFKASKFNALYQFDLWETIFLIWPGG